MTSQPTRRLALGAGLTFGLIGLTACSTDSPELPTDEKTEGGETRVDPKAFAEVVAKGPVAEDDVISANPWAKAIKESGKFRRGGTDTANLYSLKDPATGKIIGFDAGISLLLARYILGEEKEEFSQVTVDTRESLIENGSVDAVVATYSITPEREKKVDFGGPYLESPSAILVKKGTKGISSVKDLAGKKVATQSSSTGVSTLEKEAPEADVQTFDDNPKCLAALQQGRVDAYVIDQSILQAAAAANPSELELVGEPFGSADPYGIGVAKDSKAKEFVDEFLRTIEDSGLWAELWKTTIGLVTPGDAPKPPKID
jgi:ABC-type amino acid transport substrate-binding protein